MPLKKRIAESESGDEAPPVKKEKKESVPSKPNEKSGPPPSSAGEIQENYQTEKYLKLSEYRRVTIRTYNKKILVDIREFYKDKTTGELKPGSKGVSLTPEQWNVVKENTGAIDDLIAELS